MKLERNQHVFNYSKPIVPSPPSPHSSHYGDWRNFLPYAEFKHKILSEKKFEKRQNKVNMDIGFKVSRKTKLFSYRLKELEGLTVQFAESKDERPGDPRTALDQLTTDLMALKVTFCRLSLTSMGELFHQLDELIPLSGDEVHQEKSIVNKIHLIFAILRQRSQKRRRRAILEMLKRERIRRGEKLWRRFTRLPTESPGE